MPVCIRCRRTLATAELRRRKPPHTGEYVCKGACTPIGSGDVVTTPLGRGIVMNVARSRGNVTSLLVDLELHRGQRGEMNAESLWREFKPDEVNR